MFVALGVPSLCSPRVRHVRQSDRSWNAGDAAAVLVVLQIERGRRRAAGAPRTCQSRPVWGLAAKRADGAARTWLCRPVLRIADKRADMARSTRITPFRHQQFERKMQIDLGRLLE